MRVSLEKLSRGILTIVGQGWKDAQEQLVTVDYGPVSVNQHNVKGANNRPLESPTNLSITLFGTVSKSIGFVALIMKLTAPRASPPISHIHGSSVSNVILFAR